MSLYNFTSHTFTNAGATGRLGPKLDAVRSAYSTTTWANTYLNMIGDNGIQLWTVPATATYIIRAVGAGVTYSSTYTTNGMNEFQKGMDATIITTLNKDEVINILVGQIVDIGDSGTSQMGGAGGTFVVRGTQTAIIVAGGGGGRGAQKATISSNATINNNGQTGDVGGSGGSGGSGGNANSYGWGGNAYGAGGGGLTGDGANDSIRGYSGYETGGKSFINGGAGGYGDYLNGGFGGGGGYSGGGADGGGGGGYSGGGGGGHISYVGFTSGGGGGSYSITGSFLSATANNTGPGFVIIQPYIYESMFTSHTFTNAGAMGRSGPTLTNVRDAYSTTTWANTYLNMIGDNGIQLWTVPKTGKYTIDAYGGGTPCGGAGGRIKGDFALTKNNVLSIVCGQVGTASTWAGSGWYAEGGGGGTYVCVGDRIKVNMLCVAGGGGGSTNNDSTNLRSDGTKYGGWSVSVIGDSDTGGSVLGGNGSGSGGGVGSDGFLQNQQAGTQTAKCFGNASMGGYSTVYPIGVGGFGGGGNGGGNPGGGGGGFRGGDTGIGDRGGQGGTSYILASATNTLNTVGGGGISQPGKVIITLIPTTPATLTFLKTTFYIKYLLNSTISIPLTDISTNNTDTYTLTHSSGSTGGNTGVATVSTSANVGTVTIKGVGKTTITSTIAATANFDEITTTSITITVIGAGLNLTNEVMTSVDLSGPDLAGSVFSGCDLTSANLYGATFNAATDFRGSTLTSLRSGGIIGNTTLLPVGYKII